VYYQVIDYQSFKIYFQKYLTMS